MLATTDRPFLEDMEKRLQKRIIVKARGSFHVEDFEIRSPSDKAPIEKSEVAGRRARTRKTEPKRRRRKRRRRHLGPPAEVEAVLAEEEAASASIPRRWRSGADQPTDRTATRRAQRPTATPCRRLR